MTTPELTPRERELIAAYCRRDSTVKEILTVYGASRSQLDTALSKGRVQFRRPASAKPSRALRRREPVEFLDPGPCGEEMLERRLLRLLSHSVAEIENRTWPGRSADPEETARALALSVRMLVALRRVSGSQDDHETDASARDEHPPRSLAVLRDELYGHLQRISDEERSGDGAGRAEDDRVRDEGGPAPLARLLPSESTPP